MLLFLFCLVFVLPVYAQEKIKIGLLVPMTGKNKALGQSIIKAVSLAVKDIDSDLIEIIPVKFSTSADQDYRFFFEELTQNDIDSGIPDADGKITTREPDSGSQSEVSIIDSTAEFVTPFLLSDINISGVSNEINLNIFYEFSGPEGATAEMDARLMSGNTIVSTQTEDLDNPCNSGFGFGGAESCGDPDDESIVFENVNTFMVEEGSYLKVELEKVSTNNCDSGGFGDSGCDVKIFFGDIDNDNQETVLTAVSYTHLTLPTSELV